MCNLFKEALNLFAYFFLDNATGILFALGLDLSFNSILLKTFFIYF